MAKSVTQDKAEEVKGAPKAKAKGKAKKEQIPCPDEIQMSKYLLEVTLLEPMLGTVPKNPDVYKEFIESKKPEEEQDDEYKTVEAAEDRGWSGFHRDENGPFILSYMIKGFLKAAAKTLRVQSGVTGLASKIQQFVFIPRKKYRKIHFDFTEAQTVDEILEYIGRDQATKAKLLDGTTDTIVFERPVRVETMQGPRVSVLRSDVIGAGAKLTCELEVLRGPVNRKVLDLLLSYGERCGLGQWRSADWGSFEYTLTKIEDE